MKDEDLRANMAYTRGVTDNLRYSANRVETIQAMVPASEDRLSFYIDLFKYHTNWKMFALASEWGNWRYRKESELKGFFIKDEVGPTARPEAGGAEGELAIPPEQEAYLKELLAYLRENELQALFIVSPYGESLEDQQMYNYMSGIVKEAGYNFLNMNNYYDEIGIVFEEDFADYASHTNVVGAGKCTAFLKDYLLENYSFEDKRGNSAYVSWDKAYEKWKTDAEAACAVVAERIANEDYAVIEGEEPSHDCISRHYHGNHVFLRKKSPSGRFKRHQHHFRNYFCNWLPGLEEMESKSRLCDDGRGCSRSIAIFYCVI